MSFEAIRPALAELESYRHPWFVCGGWAIDLYVGEVTREHEDLEVAIFRHHQHALRAHYREWSAFKSVGRWVRWEEDEELELPLHQILFQPAEWPEPDPWEPSYDERQFFLNDVRSGVWISRRDERIRLPVRQLAQRGAGGFPIVAPEVQLLYKAKHTGNKDEHDFGLVAPLLGPVRREWLRDALELIHPGHRWIEALA
jgi:hypothetical protein